MGEANKVMSAFDKLGASFIANDDPAVNAQRTSAHRGFQQSQQPLDVICLSHLRWDFVYQRPQHLLSRAAQTGRVFFVEEPHFDKGSMRLEISDRECDVKVVTPKLPEGLQSEVAKDAVLSQMIDRLLLTEGIHNYVLWYYTPMALEFTRQLKALVTIYDCMDELSAFKNAPKNLGELERELFERADLVFTGGRSLYEAKKGQHSSVHAFPSSIDREHFAKARAKVSGNEPADQKDIPGPRLGFFGVVDERFDAELVEAVAMKRPEWQFVIIGPVVKIDAATLPQLPNIHYLGSKSYQELPDYIAGWDVALMPFARNEATRFISPTKTPEYLAAGKPVVSTSIRDVVRPYGEQKLAEIADTPDDFLQACERLLSSTDRKEWLQRVDLFLSEMSWDSTWQQMRTLIEGIAQSQQRKGLVKSAARQRWNRRKKAVGAANYS